MTKAKLKEEEGVKRKVVQDQTVKIDPKFEKALGEWQQEIDALSKQVFESEQAAIMALIDQVLTKCQSQQNTYQQTKRFMFELFDSDPGLKEHLRGLLKIKSE